MKSFCNGFLFGFWKSDFLCIIHNEKEIFQNAKNLFHIFQNPKFLCNFHKHTTPSHKIHPSIQTTQTQNNPQKPIFKNQNTHFKKSLFLKTKLLYTINKNQFSKIKPSRKYPYISSILNATQKPKIRPQATPF